MHRTLAFAFLLFAFLSACNKEEIATCNDGVRNGNEVGVDCGGDCKACSTDPVVANIQGFAQKGPFLNGSSVLLNELDSNFVQTGVSFNTQILDNTGAFSFTTIPLASNYVTLRADGFYFNEVCGGNSKTQITLNAISDIPMDGQVNVNVLTHLEKARVEYLLSSTSLSFLQAKAQAQNEILAMFNIAPSSPIDRAEILDIANNSEGDAILIAVASMLQGYRSESEFSDLMAAIIADIRTDGVLNDQDLGAQLVSHTAILDSTSIRQNIIDRYTALGLPANVPMFGSYMQNFLDSTSFPTNVSAIDYPVNGTSNLNILDPNGPTTLIRFNNGNNNWYHLAANLPRGCPGLRISITKTDNTFPCGSCCICFSVGDDVGWDMPDFVLSQTSITIASREEAWELDCRVGFNPGTYLIEYFENPSSIPTQSKTITVQ